MSGNLRNPSGVFAASIIVALLVPVANAAYQEIFLLSDWGTAQVSANALSSEGQNLGTWNQSYQGPLAGLTGLNVNKSLETETGYGWLDGTINPRSTLLSGMGLETRAASEGEGLAMWARSEATFAWKWRIGHESVPFWAAAFAQGGLLEFRLDDLTADTQPLYWNLTDSDNSVSLKLIPYHEYELRIHSVSEAQAMQDPRSWAEFALEASVSAPEPAGLVLMFLGAAGTLLRRPSLFAR